jgi:glycosyltransferase involved in cell wall biosynthesis
MAGKRLTQDKGFAEGRRCNPSGQTVLLNGSFAQSLLSFRGRLIETMVARGHHVHVSAPNIGNEVETKLRAMGAVIHNVTLARTGTNPWADLRYAFTLFQIIKSVRPDRVIGYTIKPNIWGSIAARCARVKSASMVTGLGYSFITGVGWRRRTLQFVMQKLYAMATSVNDCVVFQNPDDKRDFIGAGCLEDPNKAALVNGSGVDMDYYARAELPQSPSFLMVARLLVSKGVREYAEAALVILRERPDCRFALAGFFDEGPDGISKAEVERWVAAGLQYLGPLEDVRPALREASVYVLPSYREGTPRSVLEAMAMGRPIITTDVPGCRETVVDGVNGLLVKDRETEPLVVAMQTLADDPLARAAMGEASFNYASEKFAVDRVNLALLAHLGL